MRRALSIDEQSFGPEHPEVALDLNNLGRLLWAAGRPAEAEPLFRRVVSIFLADTRRTGQEHPHLEAATQRYLELLIAMGKSRTEIESLTERFRK